MESERPSTHKELMCYKLEKYGHDGRHRITPINHKSR
jgi:hypothetical protein